MATYLTSDMHFEHKSILNFCPDRPGDTVEEMNELLVQGWNATVSDKDTVWVLGDAVMGKRAESLSWIGKLNGTKILIPGNHDYCHPISHNKWADWKVKYMEAGFGSIIVPTKQQPSVIAQFTGVDVLMCHFPYTLGEYDDRDFSDWAPKDNGLPLIHGHVHQTWKVNNNQVNVGMDVWEHKPVHIDTVLDIIAMM